ncbi:hypothetical protein O6H91_10G028600 [Diphasiastrum complanatum]|uniref:Uncharacterized protein n=1 Tax=Diphasiastrum complanatum TaxID=34168 RepID=A0ACC2CFH2_DIPCM|nr:hypothetical protein O6H91_10G028600 [Diphasiastrum complanatum]
MALVVIVVGVMVAAWLLALLLSPWLLIINPLRPLPTKSGNGRVATNVLLVVAHPDDESMFFGPTLLCLASFGSYNIRVLSISNGNVDGKGRERENEMLLACSVLKVPRENVKVLNIPGLQDGFHEVWGQEVLAEIVQNEVQAHSINTVISFDKDGVSCHPNHCSLSSGIRFFLLQKQVDVTNFGTKPVEAWELVSTNIFRKYSGPLDLYFSTLEWWWSDCKELHCFINCDTRTSRIAMSQHRSQWLWYRRLFIILSRYTYVNTLRQIKF